MGKQAQGANWRDRRPAVLRALMDLLASVRTPRPLRAKIASNILAVIEVKDRRIESFRPRPRAADAPSRSWLEDLLPPGFRID